METANTHIVLEERCRGDYAMDVAVEIDGRETFLFTLVSQTDNPYSHRIYENLRKYVGHTRPEIPVELVIKHEKSNKGLDLRKNGRGLGRFEQQRILDLLEVYNSIRKEEDISQDILEDARKHYSQKEGELITYSL